MGWNANISLILVPLSTFRESVHFIPHEISEQVCVDLHHQVHVLVTIYNSNPVLITIYKSKSRILYIHSAFYTEKLCRNAVATFFTL